MFFVFFFDCLIYMFMTDPGLAPRPLYFFEFLKKMPPISAFFLCF